MPTFLDDLKLQNGTFAATLRPSTLTADLIFPLPNKAGTLLVDADWAAPGAIGAATANTIAATTLTTFQATAADQIILTRTGNPSYSFSVNNQSLAIKEIASGKLIGAYKLDGSGFPLLILGADAGAGVLAKTTFRSPSVSAFTAVNLPGASMAIALGAGVGTGALPDVTFDTPVLAASGTTQQTTTTKMTLKGRGALLLGTTTDDGANLAQISGGVSASALTTTGTITAGDRIACPEISSSVFRGSVGGGVNAAAVDVEVRTGRGTGVGTIGDLRFSTASQVASGSTLQGIISRMILKGRGALLLGTTADDGVNLAQINGALSAVKTLTVQQSIFTDVSTLLLRAQMNAVAGAGSNSEISFYDGNNQFGVLRASSGAAAGARQLQIVGGADRDNNKTPIVLSTQDSAGALQNALTIAAGQPAGTSLVTISGKARIGSTTESRSQAAPTSPATGELWLELDGSNYPKYGWHWRWNGTYWLSPDQSTDFSQNGVPPGDIYYFRANPAFNYFFKFLASSSYATTAQTPTAHFFTFALKRSSTTNAITDIKTITTEGNVVNEWADKSSSVDVHVNVAATNTKNFSLTQVPSGVPGGLYATTQAIYNLARL